VKRFQFLAVIAVVLVFLAVPFAAVADGNPSLEWDPAEWFVSCCEQKYEAKGKICNTGDIGDVAEDVSFRWEPRLSLGGEWIEDITFVGNFENIPGGECREVTLIIAMASGWTEQPEGTEAKAWIYAAPTNRPNHETQASLTVTSCCGPTAVEIRGLEAADWFTSVWHVAIKRGKSLLGRIF